MLAVRMPEGHSATKILLPNDCIRTAANGLNYCERYVVDAGNVYVVEPIRKQRNNGIGA